MSAEQTTGAGREADEVARAREAFWDAGFVMHSASCGRYAKDDGLCDCPLSSALDAFERAVEARAQREIAVLDEANHDSVARILDAGGQLDRLQARLSRLEAALGAIAEGSWNFGNRVPGRSVSDYARAALKADPE